MVTDSFWRGRSVLITGDTGFKGSWLSLWLQALGARVSGYALAPPTEPSLFQLADVGSGMEHVTGDVRDLAQLCAALDRFRPAVVIHMAAQSLVRLSYQDPVATYATNVMGTVNLLEAVRATPSVEAVLVVTSDKCYENQEWIWGYRENEAMGGADPYSNSKGCAELVTRAYRSSFFEHPGTGRPVLVASARAGNVIGGGDWATDRLIPDAMRSFMRNERLTVRNPAAVRPWQHVLESLHGYLCLVEHMVRTGELAEGWNFGPDERDMRPVSDVVEHITALWADGAAWDVSGGPQHHEARVLRLDSAKARERLGWKPLLSLEEALEWLVHWYREFHNGGDIRSLTQSQIARYQERVEGTARRPAPVTASPAD
jgi:CDP-glucose 4,6-dehydratase